MGNLNMNDKYVNEMTLKCISNIYIKYGYSYSHLKDYRAKFMHWTYWYIVKKVSVHENIKEMNALLFITQDVI